MIIERNQGKKLSLSHLEKEGMKEVDICINFSSDEEKGRGINNSFLPEFIDSRGTFFMDDLSSRAFISLKYILHYLPQLRSANNREGEKTTFVEISRIVLEITATDLRRARTDGT